MEFTGERMIPEYNVEDLIYSEHLLRYNFCKQFVAGKTVIDIACGSGYGTQIIAEAGAQLAHGADISPETVEYATKTYAHAKSEYFVADGTDLPFGDHCYDVAVSFETIEHLEHYQKFIDELKRVLSPSGLLIISSPNKDLYPSGNDFHYEEFTEEEFLTMLQVQFKHVKLYYQNNFLLSSLFESSQSLSSNKIDVASSIQSDGMYFVALCSDEPLPEVQQNSFIADPDEISSSAIVAERNKHISILQTQVKELTGHIDYLKNTTVDKHQLHIFEMELERYKVYYKTETEKLELVKKNLDIDNIRFDETNRILREKEDRLEQAINSKADLLAQLHHAIENHDNLTAAYKQLQTRLSEESGKSDYLYDLVEKQKLEVESKIELEAEISRIKAECVELTGKAQYLESLFNEELQKSEYLFGAVQEKETAIARINAELADAKTQISSFADSKNELLANIDLINSERIKLSTTINLIVSENNKNKEEVEKNNAEKLFLEHKINELDKDRFELKIRLEAKLKDVESLESANLLFAQKQQYFVGLGQKLVDTKSKLFDLQMAYIGQMSLHKDTLAQIEERDKSIELLHISNAEYSCLLEEKQIIIHEQESQIQTLGYANDVNLQKTGELEQLLCQNEVLITDCQTQMANQELKIADQEADIAHKEAKILLLERENEEKRNELIAVRSSFSWLITYPLRKILQLFIFLFRPIVFLANDSLYAIQLLKREGIKSFIHRFFWYLRGKRLIEEIQYDKNKKQLILSHKTVNNKEIIEFEKTKKPLVSIIIPVYNQFDYTYNCLLSIKEHSADIAYEIIIGDDKSDDETVNIHQYAKNITVVRHNQNLRFLLNCNTAAKKAKGKYVLFLNNDTKVHPDWLKHLLETFENHPQTGCVGAKLIYSDGRMQEAGGIIWDDASGWNFGRLADPELPEYNYVKETDYVSGACLMLPTSLWKEIGGFDTRFVPAYYEDTDICFEVRKHGYKVIYQPLAQVTHFEGISNGTDLGSGQKKYQIINHKKFVEKWGVELKSFNFPNAQDVFLARDRSRLKRQILVIDHYVPHFDKDAGSRSTFSYLKLLVKMGYNVTFIGDNFFKHEPYTTVLQQFGIEVLYGNYYQSHIKDWIRDNGKYFHYVFAHRMHIAPKYFVELKKYTSAKIIYVGHDLQHIKSMKEYEISKKDEHLHNHKKFKEIETAIFNTVDIIYPFSSYEAPLIQAIVPNKVVRAMPVYFFGDKYSTDSKFNARKDILFVGGFGHPPNVDAVLWFVKEILPKIWEKLPDVCFYIVGSNPPKEIKSLQHDKVVVTGFISDEELVSYYNQCRIAVLPLRVGAGVKGKLLEAMYYMLPTVTTPVATEGVPGIETCSAVASSSDEFAQAALRLYSNESVWSEYSEKGSELIHKYYSEDNARQLLSKDLI